MMGVLQEGWMVLAALLPSIGLLYLFYVVMKHLIEGDRRERAAMRALESQGGVHLGATHHERDGDGATSEPATGQDSRQERPPANA